MVKRAPKRALARPIRIIVESGITTTVKMRPGNEDRLKLAMQAIRSSRPLSGLSIYSRFLLKLSRSSPETAAQIPPSQVLGHAQASTRNATPHDRYVDCKRLPTDCGPRQYRSLDTHRSARTRRHGPGTCTHAVRRFDESHSASDRIVRGTKQLPGWSRSRRPSGCGRRLLAKLCRSDKQRDRIGCPSCRMERNEFGRRNR
jgi:hypothetical protein